MANFYYPVDVECTVQQWCLLRQRENGSFYVTGHAHFNFVDLESIDTKKIAVANTDPMPKDMRDYFSEEIPSFLKYAEPNEIAAAFSFKDASIEERKPVQKGARGPQA